MTAAAWTTVNTQLEHSQGQCGLEAHAAALGAGKDALQQVVQLTSQSFLHVRVVDGEEDVL